MASASLKHSSNVDPVFAEEQGYMKKKHLPQLTLEPSFLAVAAQLTVVTTPQPISLFFPK